MTAVTMMSADACHDCPAAAATRRAFLRDMGAAAVAALALAATASPAAALAQSVSELRAIEAVGRRRVYEIPQSDSVAVDQTNDVIIARWQNRVYAFSIKCPHRGSRLEWHGNEQRVFCPKHKARFQPDGSHASGRQSRDLDRYGLTREGSSLIVELDAVLRADRDPATWRAAVVVLSA